MYNTYSIRWSESTKKELEKQLVDRILQSGKRKDEELNKILYAIDEVDHDLPGGSFVPKEKK